MCIWAHQWQDSWSLRDVLCRETGKLKHVSTNKMMFFFFWLFCCLWIIYIYIYLNHPSYLLFLPLPLFVPEFLVRTSNLCSYLLFLHRLFLVVSSFFYFTRRLGCDLDLNATCSNCIGLVKCDSDGSKSVPWTHFWRCSRNLGTNS